MKLVMHYTAIAVSVSQLHYCSATSIFGCLTVGNSAIASKVKPNVK